MMLKPLTTVAAAGLMAAAATQAFLLPPEVSESDISIANTVAFATPEIAEKQVVELDCPGCPIVFRGRHGKPKVVTDKPNHLELSFAIDHQPGEPDRLLLSGFELYPSADPFHGALVVPQVPDHKRAVKHDDDDRKEHHKRPHRHHKVLLQELGFSLQVHPVAQSAEDQLELIALDLQIVEVGTTFVEGIPNVHVKLIKEPASGKLMIANIETTTSQTLQKTPMDKQDGPECSTFLCKWMAIFQDKLNRIKAHKGCHGSKGTSSDAIVSRPQQDGNKPYVHRRKHSWVQLLKNIATHILLPIAIGVVAGVSVSLVGMMAGTLIVTLWRVFFRRPSSRRHAGHRHHRSASKEIAAVAEEKSGLMAHQEDLPPAYEDAADEDVKKTVV